MKKYIFSSLALAAAFCVSAQTVTPRQLVVEEKDGTQHVFDTEEVAGVSFQDMPEYKEANILTTAMYTINGQQGRYLLEVDTDYPNDMHEPNAVGDAFVTLAFNAPLSEDRNAAILESGYYRAGGAQLGYFDTERSSVRARLADGTVSNEFIVAGSADVRRDANGEYDIRIELVTIQGNSYAFSYQGFIDFRASSDSFDSFKEEQDVLFDGMQMRYYANWYYPFADDATIEAFTGDFDAEDNQVNGYWLHLPIFFNKFENPETSDIRIPDGVYNIETRNDNEIPYQAYLPFTYTQGNTVEFWGTIYNTGTYVTYIDPKGGSYIGYAKSGTVTVSKNGTNFDIDLTFENGVKFRGEFNTWPVVGKFVENSSMPKKPWSTVKEDHEMDFTEESIALCYDDAEIYPGMKAHTLWLVDKSFETGDYLQFVTIGTSDQIEDGTYTIAKTFEDHTILPGWMTYSQDQNFSWYSYLDDVDADGYNTTYAPIVSGTVTIKSTGTMKHFTFDLYDDAGKHYTGEADLPGVLGDAERPARLRFK